MPNGLPSALRSGFEIGRAAGGRGGIGLALKGIADRLRTTRETEEAVGVLGRTERVKAQAKAEYPTPLETARAKYYTAAAEAPPEPKKITAVERKAIGAIRQMKAQNAPIEDIYQWLEFEGLEPEDYADEIGVYQPTPKKSFLRGLFTR